MVRSRSLISVNDSQPSFTTVYSHLVSFVHRFPSLSNPNHNISVFVQSFVLLSNSVRVDG